MWRKKNNLLGHFSANLKVFPFSGCAFNMEGSSVANISVPKISWEKETVVLEVFCLGDNMF